MKSNRRVTVTILALAALALATAAYAPHSSTLTKIAQTSAPITPCGAGPALTTGSGTPKYPAPSEDVIARGHAGL
jgi:hypothetical protein